MNLDSSISTELLISIFSLSWLIALLLVLKEKKGILLYFISLGLSLFITFLIYYPLSPFIEIRYIFIITGLLIFLGNGMIAISLNKLYPELKPYNLNLKWYWIFFALIMFSSITKKVLIIAVGFIIYILVFLIEIFLGIKALLRKK